MNESTNITRLLKAATAGDQESSDALFKAVYAHLRAIAKSNRRRWSGNHTLNTTALINEAYIRLADGELASYSDRAHFFATASKAMRQILINYAERLAAAKRGANPVKVTLTDFAAADESTFDDLLHINEVLQELEDSNPRHCKLFECRVFGGMTIEETANALDISPATVKRDWSLLNAWVFREMRRMQGLHSQG